MGGAWSNLNFVSNFLASCYYWSSLASFFDFFFRCARMHAVQTWWVVELGPTLFLWVIFWASCYHWRLLHEFLWFFGMGFLQTAANMDLKLGGWVGGALFNLDFVNSYFSLFFFGMLLLLELAAWVSLIFSDILAPTWLKLGAWVELGPT